jgi:hypothetical protein
MASRQQQSKSRTTATSKSTTSTATVTKEKKNMALTPDQINQLLSDQRGRGDYGVYLDTFVKSGSAGEEVDLKGGLLAGKTPDKVKTGIGNAIKSRDKDGNLRHPEAQNVVVISKDDHVFVINRDVVAGQG